MNVRESGRRRLQSNVSMVKLLMRSALIWSYGVDFNNFADSFETSVIETSLDQPSQIKCRWQQID